MSTAVYIGAGLDVRPVRAMKHIQKFVYVDSRPATQQPEFDLKYNQYSERFVHDFCRKMESMDFDWTYPVTNDPGERCGCLTKSSRKNTRPFVVRFFNKDTNVELEYHLNTPFPMMISDDLKKEVGKADTLIVAGYHPHECVLDMMTKPVNVVCWEGTWYGNEEHEDCKDSVIRRLYRSMDGIAAIKYYKKEYVSMRFESMHDVVSNQTNALSGSTQPAI
jgi:hypothetical protein